MITEYPSKENDNLDEWFGAPTNLELPRPDIFVDSISHLNLLNQTLSVLNNQTSGWQKQVLCSVSYLNTLDCKRVSSSTTRHDSTISCVLVWLAYKETIFYPLSCRVHSDPFTNVQIRTEKITFQLNCGSKCFEKARQLCLVVVEYDIKNRQYRWNCALGHFRKGPLKSPLTISQEIPSNEYQLLSSQIQEVMRKLDDVTIEMKNLKVLLSREVPTCTSSEDKSGHVLEGNLFAGYHCFSCGKFIKGQL